MSLSFVLLVAGLVVQTRGAAAMSELDYRSLSGVATGVVSFDAAALLHAGLVVLIVTPVARVAALAFEYARRREKLFALLAFGILLLLGVSMVTAVR